MHFESFTNFGGISSDPGTESHLTLSWQEMTSSSHISSRANDCTQLLVKILKELLLVRGILFAKLIPIFAKYSHNLCRNI